MFEHIHQDDYIETALRNSQILDGANENRNAKCHLAKFTNPGAHFHPGGIISSLTHQGDKAAMRTAQLNHP